MTDLMASFSGGRTSAYMTILLKDLNPETRVVFANTGLESPETLDFVDKCDRKYHLGVVYLESLVLHGERKGSSYAVKDSSNLSVRGEPFESVIRKYGIPNTGFPHCTRELKINPIHSWAKDHLSPDYQTAIGIRADEMDRVPADFQKKRYTYPLIDWGIKKPDILVENSRTLLNAAPSPVEPDACEWREDQDGNWFAKCGASWTFEHDGPDENGMKFCYCCGKTLLPIAFQQYVEPESLAQLSLETKFSPEAKAELDADPLFGPRVLKNAQNAAVAMRLSEVIERWQTDQISSDEAMIELCSITHLLEHPNVINPSTNSSQISSKLVEPEAHAQTIIKERGEHYAALLLKALEEAL